MQTGWEPFLDWAAFFWDAPGFDFDSNERDYKLSAVAPFDQARVALDEGDWITPLGRGFKNKDANLVTHYQFTPFLDWVAEDQNVGRAALKALWDPSDASGPERMDAFDALVPPHVVPGPGIRCNLAAYVLSAADPYNWPNYKVTATELASELTHHPLPERDCGLGARYGHALDLYDELISRAASRGMSLRDRLDAQGLMWCVAGGVASDRPDSFSSEQWDEFLAFRMIPSALRKSRRVSPRSPRLAKRKRPPRALCPLCGNDEEVRLMGPATDSDRWEFVCESGPNHPRLEPFSFSAG